LSRTLKRRVGLRALADGCRLTIGTGLRAAEHLFMNVKIKSEIAMRFSYWWLTGTAGCQKPEDGGDDQKSITWLEVDFARSQGLIVVPMLLKDRAPWPTNLVKGLGNVPVFERLQKFKSELRRFHSGFFSEQPESLDPLVAAALRKAEKDLIRQSQPNKRHIASANRDNENVVQSALALGVQRQAFSKMLADSLGIAPDDQLIVVHDESLDPFLPALIDELGHRRIQSTIIQLPKKYQLSLITHTGGDLF
jgi:hypothetical protein